MYNVGCGERITINRLWAEIRSAANATAEPVFDQPRSGDVRHSLASVDKARAELGYEPAVTLREGLQRTMNWFRPQTVAAG